MRIANVVLNDFTRDNRVLKVASLLQENGAEVTVVALHRPNLPRFERHETGGFAIQRIPIVSPKHRIFGLIKWMELVIRITWGHRRADAWHCNDAEAFAIGLVAKATRPRLKLVYDCHEFESERNAKPAWLSRSVRWMEERWIHRAEEVIVVSPSIEAAYRGRYESLGMKRISLVRNVPDARALNASSHPLRSALGLDEGAFIALYQGALMINRGVETLVAMAPMLEGTGIHLVFMGYGSLEPLVKSAAMSHAHVHFQPAVPYTEVLDYTSDADVGLVSVKPVCLSYLYCLPNKLFESIQAGIPVLVNDLPDCISLVQAYGIGEQVEGDEPTDWFAALSRVSKKKPAWKKQAHSNIVKAQNELNWGKESKVLTALYHRVGLSSD